MNFNFDWNIELGKRGRKRKGDTEKKSRAEYNHDYYLRVLKEKRRKQRGIKGENNE